MGRTGGTVISKRCGHARHPAPPRVSLYNRRMAVMVKSPLTPYIAVHDAEAAIEFYMAAFGATEEGERYPWEGKIGHAELGIRGARLYLADEFSEYNTAPRTLGGSPVTLHLEV